MAKKIRYSEPLAEVWDGYNKINKKTPLTPKEFVHQWIYRDMTTPLYENYTQAHIFVGDMSFQVLCPFLDEVICVFCC